VCAQAQVHDDRKKVRCVLVHEHVLLRQGLRRLLEDEPDLEVVGEASNAVEALQNVFQCRPDVLLTDASAFGLSAREAERWLNRASPQTRILFLGAEEDNGSGLRDLRTETAGCVVRETSAKELVEMVRGGSREMFSKADGSRQRTEPLFPKKRALTSREREVLKLLAEGRTVRVAASILGVSAKTVDAHKFNLMRKLGIHNKAELVMWAIQKRVVKMPAG
jgi:two-component system, NarL family, response regulator NreC